MAYIAINKQYCTFNIILSSYLINKEEIKEQSRFKTHQYDIKIKWLTFTIMMNTFNTLLINNNTFHVII